MFWPPTSRSPPARMRGALTMGRNNGVGRHICIYTLYLRYIHYLIYIYMYDIVWYIRYMFKHLTIFIDMTYIRWIHIHIYIYDMHVWPAVIRWHRCLSSVWKWAVRWKLYMSIVIWKMMIKQWILDTQFSDKTMYTNYIQIIVLSWSCTGIEWYTVDWDLQ